MKRLLVALSATAVLFAACGDDGGVSSGGAGDDTEATDSTDTPATDAAAATAAPDPGDTTAPTAAVSTATTAAPTTAKATTTAAPTTAKATTTAPAISFASFSVTVSPKCPTTTPDPGVSFTAVTEPPQVIVKWKLTGVIPDNVYTAVDDQNGVFENGLPTSGTATFSKDCNAQHTYYVVAELGGQKFVKSKKA